MNDPLDTGSPLAKLILHSAPASTMAESFRTLRANLGRALEQGTRRILFVSPWPNDGKSMVCANMAVAFAQIRKKVILVDGDLRRPTLTELFGLNVCPGFTTLLDESVPLEHLLKPTDMGGLYLLPSGPTPSHPADLLSGTRARTALEELGQAGDVVIIDTPPLSVCGDAMVLAPLVDGVVIVINPRQWQGETEFRAKLGLEEAGARVLGVVLNEVEERESTYNTYHYYGYGYGEHHNGSKPRSRWRFWERKETRP